MLSLGPVAPLPAAGAGAAPPNKSDRSALLSVAPEVGSMYCWHMAQQADSAPQTAGVPLGPTGRAGNGLIAGAALKLTHCDFMMGICATTQHSTAQHSAPKRGYTRVLHT